jgi:hypothetical protein
MHDLRCSLRLIAISRIAQETPTTIREYRAGREDVQHSSCCRIRGFAPPGSAVRTSSATARPHVAQALLEDCPLRSIIRQAAREQSKSSSLCETGERRYDVSLADHHHLSR